MTLSIVIVSWNTKELIKSCIESIFDNPLAGYQYEIIVTDNASSDESADFLALLENENKIVFIKNEKNLGYAAACNQGMKIAKGKYILLLGSDTIMQSNTLNASVEFLENNTQAAAVGCKLLNPDGTVQNNCKKFPTLRNAFYTYLSLDFLNKDYDMADFKIR